jgi:hypothetical protein
LILSSAVGTRTESVNRIITWGENSPEWNRALHLGGVRIGCSDAPASCADYAQKTAKSQGVDKVFLSILLNPARTITDARQYSELSRTHPVLYEVGFDDFVSQCEKLKLNSDALSALLSQISHELRSANPNLLLGITLYEDELYSNRFPLDSLDEKFRESVDLVHLYPHYRKEARKFPEAVERTKMLFPRAKIIAGLYPYDRRDYLPCVQGGSTPCTNEEEINLFTESLKERLAMLNHSNVEWIELFPGNFGMEAQWKGWQEPRSCHSERLQECIANTKTMHEVVRTALNQ